MATSVYSLTARAAALTIAVASNFAEASEDTAALFEAQTEHRVTLAFGATGSLYAQIKNGAPFDLFLSADQARPERLVAEGLALAETRGTYAVGRLVLWSRETERLENAQEALSTGDFRAIAIADPATAPYGRAAAEAIAALGLEEQTRGRTAIAQNVGQAFAMAESGAADFAFVSLASVLSPKREGPRGYWAPASEYYGPIRQDAVVLAHAQRDPAVEAAARAFVRFLASEAARAALSVYGYEAE